MQEPSIVREVPVRLDSRTSLWVYVRSVVRHAIQVYSAISLVLGLTVVLLSPWWGGKITAGAGAILLLVCYSRAAFLAWRDAVHAVPAQPPVGIAVKSTRFVVPMLARVPKGRIGFEVYLEIRNPGQEPVFIEDVLVHKWGVCARFLAAAGQVVLFRSYSLSGGIGRHFKLEPQDRYDNLGVWIEAPIQISSEEEFAREIGRLSAFSLTLRFELDYLGAGRRSIDVEATGSFEDFRREIIEKWRQSAPDLLAIAAGG